MAIEEVTYTPPSPNDLWNKRLYFLRESGNPEYRALPKGGKAREKALAGLINPKVEECQRLAKNLMATGVWAGNAWNQAIRAVLLESQSD